MSTARKSWDHDDIFNHELLQKSAVTVTTNKAFLGGKQENPHHLRKFHLESDTVYRKGYPIAGTALQSDEEKKLYLNSLKALFFEEQGHGVSSNDLPNHYLLVFALRSTQQASHVYFHPQLTNGSNSNGLSLSTQLTDSIEVFLLGEKTSTIYFDSFQKVAKNFLLSSKIEWRK